MGGMYMDAAAPTLVKIEPDLQVAGKVLVNGAQATNVNALTRKDYVDQLAFDVATLAGRWHTTGGRDTSLGTSAGWAYFLPLRAPACTIDGLGCEVTSASAAGGLIRLGWYGSHATRIEPYGLLKDAGTVACDTTGVKTITFTGVPFTGGWMWLCLSVQGSVSPAPSLRGADGFGEPWTMFGVGQVPPGLSYRAWSQGGFGGAFPATLTSLGLAAQANPKITFRTV